MRNRLRLLPVLLALTLPVAAHAQGKLGIFQDSTDIGQTRPGATLFDPATGSYRVTGGGADLWGAADQFRFIWLKLSGDATLSADVHFDPRTGDPTAKAILIVRQSLDPASPYADAAIHFDGHITLQYRETTGGKTGDTTSAQHGSTRLAIQRKGDQFTIFAGTAGHMEPASAPMTLALGNPVYVGIGVCAHNADHLETATFSNVELKKQP